jgi:hypothetical protein
MKDAKNAFIRIDITYSKKLFTGQIQYGEL